MPRTDLAATQRWFQESVVAPHERRKRRLGPAAAHVRPSASLRPDQRVGIYVEAYFARLVEALEADFPALSRLVGQERFHGICRGYLERFPSRSRSLNPLGRRLPEVLKGGARDLARLEVAMSEVFDGDAAPALTPKDFATFSPERLSRARLALAPTVRVLELDHDANPYVDAVRQERAVPRLRRKKSWTAVYRKEFQVLRLDLKGPAYAALAALRDGSTVEQAVAAAARRWKGGAAALQAEVRQNFGEWVSEGFFSAVIS